MTNAAKASIVSTGTLGDGSIEDMKLKGRDALVRIIKYQLDQYLLQANADHDLKDFEFNFDTFDTDAGLVNSERDPSKLSGKD